MCCDVLLTATPAKPTFAFGHWNGFITSMHAVPLPNASGPCQECVMTTDRDGKVWAMMCCPKGRQQ